MITVGDTIYGSYWTNPPHSLQGKVVGLGEIDDVDGLRHKVYLVKIPEPIIQDKPRPYRAIRIVTLRADRVTKVE